MVQFVSIMDVLNLEDQESVRDHVESQRSCCIIIGNPRHEVAVYYGQNPDGEMLCKYLKEQVDTGMPAESDEEVETYHAVIEAIMKSLNLRSYDLTMQTITEEHKQKVAEHLSEIMSRMQVNDEATV